MKITKQQAMDNIKNRAGRIMDAQKQAHLARARARAARLGEVRN